MLSILAGLLNLFRGGSIAGLDIGTQKQRVIFALTCGLITFITTNFSYVAAAIVAVSCFLPWLAGTGRPMSAINNSEKKALKECEPFDSSADWVAGHLPWTMRPRYYQPVWGVSWFASVWLVPAIVCAPFIGFSAFIWTLYGLGCFVGATAYQKNWWKGAEFGGGVIIGMGIVL